MKWLTDLKQRQRGPWSGAAGWRSGSARWPACPARTPPTPRPPPRSAASSACVLQLLSRLRCKVWPCQFYHMCGIRRLNYSAVQFPVHYLNTKMSKITNPASRSIWSIGREERDARGPAGQAHGGEEVRDGGPDYVARLQVHQHPAVPHPHLGRPATSAGLRRAMQSQRHDWCQVSCWSMASTKPGRSLAATQSPPSFNTLVALQGSILPSCLRS